MLSSPTAPNDNPLQGQRLLFIRSSKNGRYNHYRRMKAMGATLWCYEQRIVPELIDIMDNWIIGDVLDTESVVENVTRTLKDCGHSVNTPLIDGVLTFDEFGVKQVSAVCQALSLPGLPIRAMCVTRNKYNFRQFCRNAGLPFAPVRGIWSARDIVELEQERENHVCNTPKEILGEKAQTSVKDCSLFNFPAVFKPTEGGGSQFVERVDNAVDLHRVYNFAIAHTIENENPNSAYEWALGRSSEPQHHNRGNILSRHASDYIAPTFFVENLLVGTEVDCDVLVTDGKVHFCSISTNFESKTNSPFFMEMGGMCPTNLPSKAQAAIVDVVKQLFEALEHDNMAYDNVLGTPSLSKKTSGVTGCFHVELMLTRNGPVPIEVNCRLGGAESHVMVNSAWGVDLAVGAAMLACGLNLANLSGLRSHVLATGSLDLCTPLQMTPLQQIISVNLVPTQSGVLAKQIIPNTVFEDSAYVNHDLYHALNTSLCVPPDGFQYLGWLAVRNTKASPANDNLVRLLQLCTFELVPTTEVTCRNGATSIGLLSPNLSGETVNDVSDTSAVVKPEAGTKSAKALDTRELQLQTTESCSYSVSYLRKRTPVLCAHAHALT
eukprot:CFRG5341T1